MLLLLISASANAACVNELNVCDGDGPTYRPLPLCENYAWCANDVILQILTCLEGSIFDELLENCNFEDITFCIVQSCPPTPAPTTTPSFSPSTLPSTMPSMFPSSSPSSSPTVTNDFFAILETDEIRLNIENVVLQSYDPAGIASPSIQYSYDGLILALQEMALQGISSDGRSFLFYIGESWRNFDYGRTNLAAFLAIAMTESIAHDTCDEYSTDEVAGRYALSNACGQNFRSYQDEVCTHAEEVDMTCPVDASMEIVSSGYSSIMVGRAPPPFSCRPTTDSADYAGYWDVETGLSSQTAYSNTM